MAVVTVGGVATDAVIVDIVAVVGVAAVVVVVRSSVQNDALKSVAVTYAGHICQGLLLSFLSLLSIVVVGGVVVVAVVVVVALFLSIVAIAAVKCYIKATDCCYKLLHRC